MNVQKYPSNGSRDTAGKARRASSKVSLITGQSKPNLHPLQRVRDKFDINFQENPPN